MTVIQEIDLLFERDLREGRLKSLAMAGLMGASALVGRADPAVVEPQQSAEALPADGYGDWGQTYTEKMSTWTDSMGKGWGGHSFELRRVGPNSGQVAFSDLKVGMVVQRNNKWGGKIPGHWDKSPYKFTVHRIVRIDSRGHLITKGDNNDREDWGYLTPENTRGVVIGVDDPEKSVKYELPQPHPGKSLAKESIDRLFR